MPDPTNPPLPPSTPIAVIGAGTMGAGIAQIAAGSGHPVLLYDTRPNAAEAAIAQLHTTLDKLTSKGRLTPEQAAQTKANLQPAPALEALTPCGLILEAIIEDLEAKRTLFTQLEALTPPETLFATNTSSLSITAIAAPLCHPERLAGMHFFNPAPLMPLVEIISGLATSPATLNTLEATAQSWGKQTVRARSTPGFIVNRVARPFYAEALRLLAERAADPATLDAILRDCGNFRMGPFELMDLIGLDINLAVTRSVFEATFHDPRFTPSLLQKELVEAGHLGRKTGRGFYTYTPNPPPPEPHTLPPTPLPTSIRLFGNDPLTTILRQRLTDFQLHDPVILTGAQTVQPKDRDKPPPPQTAQVLSAPAHADLRLAQTPHACLYRTDGRSATQRAHDTGERNTVLVDLAFDLTKATRLALAAADQAHPAALPEIAALLQAANFTVSPLDDAPGMLVLRTVATLANEAADAVHQGICTAADCDKAMSLGTNYPQGPLAWADTLGAATLVTALDHLHTTYGDPRYRVSPLLRRKALTNTTFHPPI